MSIISNGEREWKGRGEDKRVDKRVNIWVRREGKHWEIYERKSMSEGMEEREEGIS